MESEFLDLKERLAGDRVALDVPRLRSGIAVGETNIKELYEQSGFPVVNGVQLLHNPFFKVAKKKKKKKKK